MIGDGRLGWWTVALLGACATLPAAETPNVVLLLADDMGWGDPGFQGGRAAKTPALDAMAANGLVFERFYAASPVCSPTRGSCLTGRHPDRYGILSANVGHLPADEPNLGAILGARGYATGHFGKWHLGTLTRDVRDSNRGGPRGSAHYAPPWERGFETTFSTEAKVPTFDPLWRPRAARNDRWWDPVSDLDDAFAYGTRYWSGGVEVTEGTRGDDSRVIVDRVVPFLRRAVAAERPFFAVVWFHAPHLPVVADAAHRAAFAGRSPYEQHYLGSIVALDEQVGRLRSELRALGVADRTLLWFASDNGPEGDASAPGSAGGLRGRKRSLYEGGVRVPGVLEWPARVNAPRRTPVPASTLDYLPTVLAALGAEPPAGREYDGVSLLPVIEGRADRRGRPIPFAFRGRRAVVDGALKLLVSSRGDAELYDLDSDPAESRNLATERLRDVERLRVILDAWTASCRADASRTRPPAGSEEVEQEGVSPARRSAEARRPGEG